MLMYICGHCGKSNPVGERCSCRAKADAERNKKYDMERRDHERSAFYQSPAWEAARLAVKSRAIGMDQYAATQSFICWAEEQQRIISSCWLKRQNGRLI